MGCQAFWGGRGCRGCRHWYPRYGFNLDLYQASASIALRDAEGKTDRPADLGRLEVTP